MQKVIISVLLSLNLLVGVSAFAFQQNFNQWDLSRCIAHAQENSIQVKQALLEVASGKLDLVKSRSEWMPAVNASVSEDFVNTFDAATAGFSLSSNMPLYKGGAIQNGIKRSGLAVEQANLSVEESQKSITLSIVQAYLNVLYAKESFDYNNEVVAASQKQVDRIRELHKAGSVARKDLLQLEAQLASDSYSLVVAKNSVVSNTTTLKQLLELPVADTFNVFFPDLDVDDSAILLPSLHEAISAAMDAMPEIKNKRLGTAMAETDLKIAKSGYLPSLSLSAGYSTTYSSGLNSGFGNQLSENQMKKLGLTLSIPIFNRNTTRVSIQQSKISINRAQLQYCEAEKNLIQKVETVYQDAIAAISRYKSAKLKMNAAAESFMLSEEQFTLGMVNAVELLDAKTLFLNAKSELVQSKYTTVLNLKVLDFYMGNPITL